MSIFRPYYRLSLSRSGTIITDSCSVRLIHHEKSVSHIYFIKVIFVIDCSEAALSPPQDAASSSTFSLTNVIITPRILTRCIHHSERRLICNTNFSSFTPKRLFVSRGGGEGVQLPSARGGPARLPPGAGIPSSSILREKQHLMTVHAKSLSRRPPRNK